MAFVNKGEPNSPEKDGPEQTVFACSWWRMFSRKRTPVEEAATEIRNSLIDFEMNVLTVGVVYGLWCPAMMILTPLVVCHQLLARKESKSKVTLSIDIVLESVLSRCSDLDTHSPLLSNLA